MIRYRPRLGHLLVPTLATVVGVVILRGLALPRLTVGGLLAALVFLAGLWSASSRYLVVRLCSNLCIGMGGLVYLTSIGAVIARTPTTLPVGVTLSVSVTLAVPLLVLWSVRGVGFDDFGGAFNTLSRNVLALTGVTTAVVLGQITLDTLDSAVLSIWVREIARAEVGPLVPGMTAFFLGTTLYLLGRLLGRDRSRRSRYDWTDGLRYLGLGLVAVAVPVGVYGAVRGPLSAPAPLTAAFPIGPIRVAIVPVVFAVVSLTLFAHQQLGAVYDLLFARQFVGSSRILVAWAVDYTPALVVVPTAAYLATQGAVLDAGLAGLADSSLPFVDRLSIYGRLMIDDLGYVTLPLIGAVGGFIILTVLVGLLPAMQVLGLIPTSEDGLAVGVGLLGIGVVVSALTTTGTLDHALAFGGVLLVWDAGYSVRDYRRTVPSHVRTASVETLHLVATAIVTAVSIVVYVGLVHLTSLLRIHIEGESTLGVVIIAAALGIAVLVSTLRSTPLRESSSGTSRSAPGTGSD